VRGQHRRISCHLHSAQLPYMLELLSELFSAVLGWMIAQNTSINNKRKLLTIARRQHLLSSHVHEANVVQTGVYLCSQLVTDRLRVI